MHRMSDVANISHDIDWLDSPESDGGPVAHHSEFQEDMRELGTVCSYMQAVSSHLHSSSQAKYMHTGLSS